MKVSYLYTILAAYIQLLRAQYLAGNSTNNELYLKNKLQFGNLVGGTQASNANDEFSLDPEWNYSSENFFTNEHIPPRIFAVYRTYNNSVSTNDYINEGCSVRVLFNKNSQNPPHIIKFDLNTLKEDERIVDVEMLYFFTPQQIGGIINHQMVLRIYQLTSFREEMKNVTNLKRIIDTHKLLNVAYVSYTRGAWQVFKIKKVVENWINNRNNFGIVMTMSTTNGNGYVRNFILNDTNSHQYRTYLIVTTTKKYPEPSCGPTTISPPYGTCKKVDHYIDFRKIAHLKKIIIAPDGYMAHDCYGSCEVSMLTNHMKLLHKSQNFTNLIRVSYCVPVQYKSLPIMFYDVSKNIVIKIYKQMIVTECGCR